MEKSSLSLAEKNSLLVEMWMLEKPKEDRVFWMLRQLQEEKAFLLECLVKGDNELRQTVWPQLDEVKFQIAETEWYINLLINKQDN